MITSIKFDKKIFEEYSIIKDDNLNNLNRINVFIGKNNSGRSRFLRLLLKTKFDVETTIFNSHTLNSSIDTFRNYVLNLLSNYPDNNLLSQFHQAFKELPKISFTNSSNEVTQIKNTIEALANNLYNRVHNEGVKYFNKS